MTRREKEKLLEHVGNAWASLERAIEELSNLRIAMTVTMARSVQDAPLRLAVTGLVTEFCEPRAYLVKALAILDPEGDENRRQHPMLRQREGVKA